MGKSLFLLAFLISTSKAHSQPPSFSWMGVESPDQLQQGPCQVFAVVSAMETWQRLLYGSSAELSHAHIYSKYVGGSPLGVSMDISLPFLKTYGVVERAFLPHISACNIQYPCPNPSNANGSCYYNGWLDPLAPNFIDRGTPWKNCAPTPSNPDPNLPGIRYRVGDFAQLTSADYATTNQLKLAIINYGPIPFGSNNVYSPTPHAFCLYGWDTNGNWLVSDSWPGTDLTQKKSPLPISSNITGGSYFIAYRLKKSADNKPAVYRQQRMPHPTVFNNWVDNIQTIVPITNNSFLNEVFKITGPSYVAPSGTFSIPGLQYLTAYTVQWSSEVVSGTGTVNITPNGTGASANVNFSGASATFKAKITATITWPNGIEAKVFTAPIQAITYTIAKTHNWCLNTNKREIQYAVTANPTSVNLLLTGAVAATPNSIVTSSSQGSTFTFTITTALPSSCGVILVVKDQNGLKLGEHTNGEYLGPCGSGYKIPAGQSDGIVKENTLLTKLLIYPNPAKDKLYLQSGDYNNYTINVLDMTGRILTTARVVKPGEINVSSLAPGMYFLHLMPDDKSKSRFVKPFIKE